MRYHYRCTTSRCRKRITLRRLAEEYVRCKKCPGCGGRLARDPEVRRRHKREVCLCDGLPYPHRIGTRYCVEYQGELDDAYYEERYRGRG